MRNGRWFGSDYEDEYDGLHVSEADLVKEKTLDRPRNSRREKHDYRYRDTHT